MKLRNLCLILGVGLQMNTNGQGVARSIQESWLRINDSVFVCRYEQSWDLYAEFLKEQTNLAPFLPVEELTSMPEAFSLPPRRWENPDYRNYPVEGISHEAALAFCDWLTRQYLADPQASEKKLRFRLPTHREWTLALAAFPESEYPWYGQEPVHPNGRFAANLRYSDLASAAILYEIDGFLMMAPVGSFEPNRLGLYDMIGNVAEMISEEGKCMGGHWDVELKKSGVLQSLPCGMPDPRFGFRWVAVLR